MLVWRICSRQYRAFDGEGARLHGGRWNFPGVRVVYTSGSLALATLELLVHVDAGLLPEDLLAISVQVPEEVESRRVEDRDLPSNWRQYPAPERLQEIGTEWARAGRTVILSVPSAIVPQERSYLLNPAHAEFARLKVSKAVSFRLDARLRK